MGNFGFFGGTYSTSKISGIKMLGIFFQSQFFRSFIGQCPPMVLGTPRLFYKRIRFWKVFFFLGSFFFLFSSAFSQNNSLSPREQLEQNQTQLAYQAREKGDWLTLIELARQAHRQKQDPLWENGLIAWAKEFVLYQHNPSGALHLAGYYRDVKNWNQEEYWHRLAQEWKEKKSRKSNF